MRVRRGAPILAVLLIAAPAFAQANSHYLSDVIAGATMGIVAGRSATIEIARTRLRLAPAPVAGGLGVSIAVGPR